MPLKKREPELSEQIRRDLDARGKENFRATFLNPPGTVIPDGTLGTSWKCADFNKKDSEDHRMWLFEPDNDKGNIFYCEEGALRMSPREPEPGKRQMPEIGGHRGGPDMDMDR